MSGRKYALIGSKGFSTDEYCYLAEDKIEKRFKNERKRLIKSYEAAKEAGIETIIIHDRYSNDDRLKLEAEAHAYFETYEALLAYAHHELLPKNPTQEGTDEL